MCKPELGTKCDTMAELVLKSVLLPSIRILLVQIIIIVGQRRPRDPDRKEGEVAGSTIISQQELFSLDLIGYP